MDRIISFKDDWKCESITRALDVICFEWVIFPFFVCYRLPLFLFAVFFMVFMNQFNLLVLVDF
jgi:hypothetical protein